MSFLLIGETVNKHDLLSFLLGIIGIALMTDPFSNLKGINDLIGISLASLAAVIFNIGFISLRHVKKELNAWQIVFHFTMANILFSPLCIIGEQSI